MVYGNPYLPSEKNGWKPRKRDNSLLETTFLIVLVILSVFVLNAVVDSFLPSTARAQVIELKLCRTNKECCELALEGNTGYVREESVEKKCEKLLNHPSL